MMGPASGLMWCPWQRAGARGCRSSGSWPAPGPPRCCSRASMAAPSAATCWPCAPGWRPSASWKKTACCSMSPRGAQVWEGGQHGSTFGGNLLAMRAGLETIRIMEEDGLLQHVATVGGQLKAALERALGPLPGVKEIRGQGLMLGIELGRPCTVLVGRAAEAGLLLSVTADSVIRLVPPLILSSAEADEIVAKLVPLVKTLLAESE